MQTYPNNMMKFSRKANAISSRILQQEELQIITFEEIIAECDLRFLNFRLCNDDVQ